MPLENKCPLCGKINPNTEWYCESCGAKLPLHGNRAATQAEPGTRPAPTAAPRTSVPTPSATPRSKKGFLVFAILAPLLMASAGGLYVWRQDPRSKPSTSMLSPRQPMPDTITGNNFVILSRDDGPRHLDINVAVAMGHTNAQLQTIAKQIEAGEKSKKWVQIWFNGADGTRQGKMLGTYDSRNSDLLLYDERVTPAPPPQIFTQSPSTSVDASSSAPAHTSGFIGGATCNDGSHSNASGRGACSRHGGVAHWN